jgi:hypothetical protein
MSVDGRYKLFEMNIGPKEHFIALVEVQEGR